MSWWRSALVLSLMAGALGVLFVYSGLPPELVAQTASARFLKSGIYAVGDIDYRLIDATRPTAANGDFAGLQHREYDTRVWFPRVENKQVAPGVHPLVVYSHGFSSSKMAGEYIASFLARQGYIVVAADYPLTRLGAPGGALVTDVVNQPADVSFLIDTLLGWDIDPDSPFFERIDAGRIGVVGVSLGGLTSTLLAFHPRWRDQRVKLAVSIAGPSSMFEARFFQASPLPFMPLPFMMVASTGDALVDYDSNAAPIPDKIPGATLVSINNGSHLGYSGLSRYLRWLRNPDAVACRYIERQLARQPIQDGWYPLIGSPEEGAVANGELARCASELPEVINPVLQQWITTLAVYSFIQQRFARTAVEIAAAKHYLYNILPREFPGVVVDDAD
jgi:pimeloyl-ACP methyl ester carboxylesterase